MIELKKNSHIYLMQKNTTCNTMKHLKSYENTTEDEYKQIKKYLVYKLKSTNDLNNNTDYFIDTMININKLSNKISCKMTYHYNEELQKFEKLNDIESLDINLSKYLESVLFTSNILKECFDYIENYIQTIKYNI